MAAHVPNDGRAQQRGRVGPRGETFRVLKDREVRDYGEYRTGRLVMQRWDALSTAGWDPSGYASPLTVPPGDAGAWHGDHTR